MLLLEDGWARDASSACPASTSRMGISALMVLRGPWYQLPIPAALPSPPAEGGVRGGPTHPGRDWSRGEQMTQDRPVEKQAWGSGYWERHGFCPRRPFLGSCEDGP